MRSLFLILIVLGLSGGRPSAEDGIAKFLKLSFDGALFQDGQLVIYPLRYSRLWLNGVRLPIHTNGTHTNGSGTDEMLLKPGDILYQADFHDFIYRYRLDSLTPKEAHFTRSTYATVRVPLTYQSWKVGLGKRQSQETLVLDFAKLTQFQLEHPIPDGGPPALLEVK